MTEEKETKEEINEESKKKATKKKPRKKSGILGSRKNKDKEKIADLQEELDESKDKYLRLFAEFENFKKRNAKEKIELRSSATADTLRDLLTVLDDFDRAKQSADDDTSSEEFSEGVTLVYQKIHSVLSAKGIKAMETNGEAFDPEFHEAITEIPAPTDDMKGKIIDTIEKGYVLNEKIIRFPKVVVGK